jgi:hypothetical protein
MKITIRTCSKKEKKKKKKKRNLLVLLLLFFFFWNSQRRRRRNCQPAQLSPAWKIKSTKLPGQMKQINITGRGGAHTIHSFLFAFC